LKIKGTRALGRCLQLSMVHLKQPSASMHTVDKTALEPSPNRTLSAISVAVEHPLNRISNVAQSSLKPSGNALFALQSGYSSK
jgi:hypothetical protein